MSSIASSRKGRPNAARDTDFIEVTADFERTIDQWRRTEHVEWQPDDEWIVDIACLAGGEETGTHWGNEPFQRLNEYLVLPPMLIKRGPDGVDVYKLELRLGERVVLLRHIIIDGDDEQPINLLECRHATSEEIESALAYVPEPEPEPQPAAPAPTFTRIPRTEGDCASFLGFDFGGPDERNIRLPQCWQALGFHIASPQIIGAISGVPGLQLKLFDSWGNLLLETFQSMPTVRFDQCRLEPGDYLLAFHGPGIEARGTYVNPNARLLADEPTKPVLNDVLWASEKSSGHQLAVPLFRFAAE